MPMMMRMTRANRQCERIRPTGDTSIKKRAQNFYPCGRKVAGKKVVERKGVERKLSGSLGIHAYRYMYIRDTILTLLDHLL